MQISKVSMLNFYGSKSQAVKNLKNKVKNVEVDFSQYAYSIPTDAIPHVDSSVIKKHTYMPEDTNINMAEVQQEVKKLKEKIAGEVKDEYAGIPAGESTIWY